MNAKFWNLARSHQIICNYEKNWSEALETLGRIRPDKTNGSIWERFKQMCAYISYLFFKCLGAQDARARDEADGEQNTALQKENPRNSRPHFITSWQ